jgi:multicomponent K+:H+ antiporter subunit E
MRRLLPMPVLSFALWVLWLLMANSYSPGQMVLGAVFAWLVPLVVAPFWLDIPRVHNMTALLRFILVVHVDILTANLSVARLILGSPKKLRPAFVEVPLDVEDEFVITLLASVVSLTPGTVSADISADRKVLLVHTLSVDDIDALVGTIKQRYEAPLKEIFAC